MACALCVVVAIGAVVWLVWWSSVFLLLLQILASFEDGE